MSSGTLGSLPCISAHADLGFAVNGSSRVGDLTALRVRSELIPLSHRYLD